MNAFATVAGAEGAATATTTGILVNAGTYHEPVTFSQVAPVTVQGAAVVFDSLSDSTVSSLLISSGTTLTVGGGNQSTTFGSVITGGGSFVKAGSGTMVLAGQNSYTGGTEVAGGTLQLGTGSAIVLPGTGSVTVDATATLAIEEPGTAAVPTTFANSIGGPGNVQVLGASASTGAVLLTGANSYSGVLGISGGRVTFSNLAALGTPSAVNVTGTGQFSFGTLTGVNMMQPLSLASTGFTDAVGTTGGLLFTGTTNTWSGPISVSGTARISAFGGAANLPSAITGTGTLQFGAGTATAERFQLTNAASSVANVTVQSNASVLLGAGPAVVTLSNAIAVNSGGTLAYNTSGITTFAGTITGGGALAVQGGGTLTLASGASVTIGTNTNTATGIWVSDNVGGTIGAGTLNILPGATLTDAGVFFVGDAVASPGTVNQSGGIVNLTNTAGTANLATFRIEQLAGIAATSTYNLTGGSLTALHTELTLGNDGNGVLNISGASTVATLLGIRVSSATSLTTGEVNLASGTLQLGASGIYAGTTVGNQLLNVGSGLVQDIATNVISVPIELSGAATFDTQSFASNVIAPIGGAGSLTKLGSGSLEVTSNNAYSGGTSINAGTLTSLSTSSLGTGPITENGGTLSVSGNTNFANPATAVVSGFNGGSGWTPNSTVVASPPTISGNDLTITSAVATNATSAWFNQKVGAAAFNATFTYTQTAGTTGGDGFTIAWQNAAAGNAAIGGTGVGMGYSGIGSSFAIAFDINAARTQGIAFSENGTVGTFLPLGNGVSLTNGTPVAVAINYDGALMTVTLTQGANVYSTSFGVNLVGLLGTNIATLGFTGATSTATSKQDITGFFYASSIATPQPNAYVNSVVVPAGSTATTNVNGASTTPTVTMGLLSVATGSTLNVTGGTASNATWPHRTASRSETRTSRAPPGSTRPPRAPWRSAPSMTPASRPRSTSTRPAPASSTSAPRPPASSPAAPSASAAARST